MPNLARAQPQSPSQRRTSALATSNKRGRPRRNAVRRNKSASRPLRQIHQDLHRLTSSPFSHDATEVAFATAISHELSKQDATSLVWLMIVGPPSSDKTETVLHLRDLPNIYHLDTLTENSFASGYVNPKSGAPAVDLLPLLDGKCLTIKDLTTLFSLREDQVKKILGDLQSIFDGEFHKFTGTRGAIDYQSRFSMVACITPIALARHHRYISLIGSRFLAYRILPLTEEQRAAGFALSWKKNGQSTKRAKVKRLRQLVAVLGKHLLGEPSSLPTTSPKHRETMNRLATLLTRGRAVIQFRKDQPSSTYTIEGVQIEEPWRALQQLQALGYALVRLHGRTSMTDHEMELLRRVVLFSMPSDRFEVLQLFSSNPQGLSRDSCAQQIKKSYGRAEQILDELVVVMLVTVEDSTPKRYRPIPDFADLIGKPVEPLDHIRDLKR